jgi:hypothetical protein
MIAIDPVANCRYSVFNFVVPFQFHEKDEDLEEFPKMTRQ